MIFLGSSRARKVLNASIGYLQHTVGDDHGEKKRLVRVKRETMDLVCMATRNMFENAKIRKPFFSRQCTPLAKKKNV